ncbi:MAG: glycosyltransferase [Lachnospiraceae bacterium]|nr:glycosyltransferase [Lachnospiraceae bacterium]
MPFLSIIIPIYNVEPYLPKCLDSILAQTFTDFEVLLIDDGSTDGSSALADSYAAKDARIRCFHKENGGHMSARQAGFEKAAGEYIAFVDSDDWIDPAMYERMCAAAGEYGVDMVCCNYTSVTPTKQIERRDFCDPGFYDKPRLETDVYPRMLFSGHFFHYGVSPSLCNKLFRRTLLEKHLFHVPLTIKLGEDGLAAYPCLLGASSVYFLPESFYYYRSNGNSLTHTMDSGRLAENRLLFDTYDRLIDLAAYPCMEKQLLYYYAYQCLLTFPPVFRTMQGQGADFKKEFCEECGYPPIRQAFRAVKTGDVSGLHNKAYAFCIRHRLYRLFCFLLKH